MPAHRNRSRLRRIFAPGNVLSVTAGTIVFVLGVVGWPTNRGAFVSAIVAAVVSGAVWLVWWRTSSPPRLDRLISADELGSIPTDDSSPAPIIADPTSGSADSYRRTLSALESRTHGQVLLVTSPSPGQGATTVAINLAAAATQAGRRVLLVDGDPARGGVSRFLGTGPEPGLTDLAAGAELGDVARLWEVGPNAILPVIPAGSPTDDPAEALANPRLGEMIERVGERADLVLVDSPPVLWNGASGPLATHADGTLLVVSEHAPRDGVAATAERLDAAGAPVLGYVVNRADMRSRFWRHPLVRATKRMIGAFIVIVTLYAAFTGAQLLRSWQDVDRGVLNVDEAQSLLPLPEVGPDLIEGDGGTNEELAGFVVGTPATGETQAFLVIGGDQVAGAADVIMLLVLPGDGSKPFMVSLPRDLYLPNRCTGGYTRINATIHGCDDISGPTLLALTVEDFTGIEVDHFAMFDFEGFERIIDGVGGVEICVEYPVRDSKSGLDLPAGCTNATGEQALAWVRSRHTQQKVDGRWRSMPGAGDLLRNQHQQEVILQLFSKLKTFESPSDLTRKVAELSDNFTLDDQLGLADAIALAWQLRDLDLEDINRLTIPVRLTSNKKGQSILVPTAPFADVLAEAYPDLAGTPSAAAN